MWKTILIVVVVLIAGVLVFAASKPDTFRVQRSQAIKAPPEKIVGFIEDFHRWQAWSPYEALDPAMKRSFSGAASGSGAVYAWDGNNKAGQGRMEILAVAPARQVTIQIDFMRPMTARNTVEFTLVPQGDTTEVGWAMHGPMPYVSKLISVFVSMDKLVGGDFEKGLAGLKAQAER